MPKRKSKETETKNSTPAKKVKVEEAKQQQPPAKKQPPPKPQLTADEIIDKWFNSVRFLVSDNVINEFSLNENSQAYNEACTTLWSRLDMSDMFNDIWNNITHGLEDQIDIHSELVDVMLGIVETDCVREKLIKMSKDAGLQEDVIWKKAGQRLWNGWTEELKFIKL